MEIRTIQYNSVIVLEVDEIRVTLSESSTQEIKDLIANLLDVAYTLASYTDKPFDDYLKDENTDDVF